MEKKKIIKITVVSFLAIIYIVLFQSFFHLLPEVSLRGVILTGGQPRLSIKNWFNGKFQTAFESWFDSNLGLRGYFVKTDNEINYRLFDEIHQKTQQKIIVGERNNLFEKNYIDSFVGRDHKSFDELQQRVADLKKLQDALSERGIDFVFLVAPSKATFCPENMPSQFLEDTSEQNQIGNYDQVLPLLSINNINYVDARYFLLEQKSSSKYPLFSKSGTHWTQYGSCLVVEKVLAEVNDKFENNYALPDCEDIEISVTPRKEDKDLADLANLWSARQFYQPLAYPRFDQPVFNDINLLMVGDSFSWAFLKNIFESGAVRDYNFYYYFNSDYNSQNISVPVNKDNNFLKQEILKRNLVIVEANDAGLGDIGFGFVSSALNALEN